MMLRAWLCLSAAFLSACARAPEWNGSLEEWLLSQPGRFGPAMAAPEIHRVQVIYTRIDRDARNVPTFTSFTYRLNADEYFYPASTVKLPTALAALEKINRLDIDGLSRDTVMRTGTDGAWQTPADADPGAEVGLPTVGRYIRKILLVSDNDAFNRLYEFVGQQPLNESLHDKGFSGTRIMHRLEVALSVEDNRRTNPVVFVDGEKVVYKQPARRSERSFTAESPIPLGRAEIVDGRRLERPKDFAEKNAFPLQDLHDVIRVLMFPESMPAERRFMLTGDDYRFVHANMSAYPGDSGIGEYSDRGKYPDGYVKFLMFGGTAASIPDNIRIFNKVGDAYGFLTDAAYVVDFDAGIEFILAATVYANENQTFNDDTYEYDEVGMPFLRELGQAIYDMERMRERNFRPDLSRFRDLEERPDREQEAEGRQRNADHGANDAQ